MGDFLGKKGKKSISTLSYLGVSNCGGRGITVHKTTFSKGGSKSIEQGQT